MKISKTGPLSQTRASRGETSIANVRQAELRRSGIFVERPPDKSKQAPSGAASSDNRGLPENRITGCRPAATQSVLPRRFYKNSAPTELAARAFTLIELLVVVIILGILAATIIPQFIGTTQEAKVGAAKANVAELGSAITRFNINMDRYPTTEEGLKVLVEPPTDDADKKWRGPYIDILRADPWGRPYQYRNPGTHRKTSFDLWSRGADGSDGGDGDGADIGNW